MRTNRNSGFTLVEIMIVVVAVGLLAAIAIPNFNKARVDSQRNACIANLKLIDGAKQTWAAENKKAPGDIPTDIDLKVYIAHSRTCPAGGICTFGPVKERPKCSIPEHSY
ncbi:MAG: type II secretion system protein [Candidatus Paceibacterota bacterium]|jgi:prepilin-type N-terminal cleavage/methylation domain-containing protein